MKNPGWKTKSTKIIYKSAWLTLQQDEVIIPDQTTIKYDIVKRRNFSLIIPKNKSKFYMVEEYRYAIGSPSLEFPQGFYENDESPEENAKRELEEEIGLKAGKLTFLNTLWVSVGFLQQQFAVFLAEDFSAGIQNLDATEKGLVIKEFSFEEIADKIKSGEINSSPTIAGFGLYLIHSKNS